MDEDQEQIWNFGTVVNANETHRLSLYYFGSRKEGYDFHSLVLEQKDNNIWSQLQEITQEEFQSNYEIRRWVSQLHSFDQLSGHAIIQVAEDTPIIDGLYSICFYSWRRWDLLKNEEIETLQICKDPFDPFEPKDSYL